jgi:hypothetical protein
MVLRHQAGQMTASRQPVQNVGKTTCQSGPSTYDSIEAINKHLAQTSGRMRRRQGHRPADPRRCGLARRGAAHWARQHRAPATFTPRTSAPELNATDPSTGSGHLRVSARQLSHPLRLCHRRGDPRRLPRCGSRCLDRPDRRIRGHRLNWNQRLGKGQNLGRLVSEDD